MSRLLPVLLRRPANLISVPELDRLPVARRAGFLHGDPSAWAPVALARLHAEPWSDACDLLLAPAPRPGAETATLLEVLDGLPAHAPAVLYERDWPVWPNLLLHEGGDDRGCDFASPGAGLRAYRSGFRHAGAGFAEALQVLSARRTADLLRGCARAERGGADDSLENRRYLVTALDHQRSAAPLAAAAPRLAPARRVAVVAPHFDDETLMAGGAILAARASGAEVRVIWLTDGARGVRGVAPAESARLRQEEARAAMDALGVRDLHFLDAPEERLRARGPWRSRLRALLEEFRPERTHVAWWADNSRDHYEAARALRAAWPRSLAEARIAAAGVWAPLPGGASLPLDAEVRKRKDAAIRAYASQLQAVDYRRFERGLARWLAGDGPGSADAERHWECSAREHFATFRASGSDRRIWV